MVTRRDIAERLGVSVSVVSRALNNSGYVEREKREQILKLAEELGYRRTPAALEESNKGTRRLVFYSINIRNPFYFEMFNGMIDVARERGYDVLLSRSPDFDYQRYSMAEGVIFASEVIAANYLNSSGKNDFRPAVCAAFGAALHMPRHVTRVECDLWRGSLMMIDYLRQRGHTRIAMASPYPEDTDDPRVQSWRSSMFSLYGGRLSDYYFSVTDETRSQIQNGGSGAEMRGSLTPEDFFENGMIAARDFVQSGCDATAVICFNEEMALGFLKGVRALGVRVPEDLSVTGYDGTYLRRYFDTPLTVLSLHPHRMGRCCAETVLDMIAGQKGHNTRILPVEILEGATVRAINGQ